MEKPPRPTLFDFHGVSMTKYFTKNWDNVQNFKARPDDIVIATYPKAGKYTKSQFFSYLLASLISCACILGWKEFNCLRNHMGLLHAGSAVLRADVAGPSHFCPYSWKSAIFGGLHTRWTFWAHRLHHCHITQITLHRAVQNFTRLV